jgi:hypothetical protein
MGPSPRQLFHTVVLVGSAVGLGSCHHRALEADETDAGPTVRMESPDAGADLSPADAIPTFTVPDASVVDAPADHAAGDVACQGPYAPCGTCQCCVIIV